MTATPQVALVTGASSGIGKAAALALADAGSGWSARAATPRELSPAARRRHVFEDVMTEAMRGGDDPVVVQPVMDRAFPFDSTNEAMAYVDKGRAKGKVVVKVR